MMRVMTHSRTREEKEVKPKKPLPTWLKVVGVIAGIGFIGGIIGDMNDDEPESVQAEVTEPADAPETVEDAAEETPDSAEKSSTEFEFDTQEFDWGKEVLVRWDIETSLTGGMTERHAEHDSLEAIQQAAEMEPDYDRISLNGYTETTDEYGNEDSALAIIAGYDRETVEQINFDNPENVDLWSINDSGGGCIPCD